MNVKLLCILLVLAFKPALPACADGAGKEFHLLRPDEITSRLGEIHRKYSTLEARLKVIAFSRVGTPYVLGCLGEETPPDTKPLFRVDETDCTVFVLTTAAMAHKPVYRDAREMMKELNYHNPPAVGQKVVTYQNRIHFTYDRLHCSPFFKDITMDLLPPSKLQKVAITLNRKSDGTKLLDIPWEKKVTGWYIPAREVTPPLLAKLPGVCNVGFVRKKNFALGLIISHEGLIIDNQWLVHADSRSKKVAKMDFLAYFNRNSDYFDGVVISKIL
jgi:hypothetical protein